MKRWTALGLMLAVLVLAAGCGPEERSLEPNAAKEPLALGLLVCTGQVEDGQYNELLLEGLKSLGQPVLVSAQEQDDSTIEERLTQLIADGAEFIWGSEAAAVKVILPQAAAHPELYFAVHDAEQSDLPDNVFTVSYRSWEGAFLAGYAAAMMTETNKVGMLGGRDEAVIWQFEIGYNAGVQYAAKALGKTIEVYTIYVGAYDEADMGQQLAGIMYHDDCDVLFQAAGVSGLGAIKEAQAQNKYIIGVDQDQSALAPEQMLLSVTKGISTTAAELTKRALAGDFPAGEHLNYGLAEGGVDIAVTDNIPPTLQEQLSALKKQIIDGQLAVPYDQASYEAFIQNL